MSKSRIWLLVLAACVPCLLLADDDNPPLGPAPRNVEVVWQHLQRPQIQQPAILDEPLRLEFQIDEGDGHRFDVVCAAEEYRISIDMGNADGENHVEITGTLRPRDDAGKLFLTFDATIHHANLIEGNEVTFSASGSTIVARGEKTRLVSFPGPVLSVTVSPVN